MKQILKWSSAPVEEPISGDLGSWPRHFRKSSTRMIYEYLEEKFPGYTKISETTEVQEYENKYYALRTVVFK